MAAPVVSTGTTISGANFSGRVVSITPPSMSRESLETSHLATTAWKTFLPGKLVDGGEFGAVIQFDGGAPTFSDPAPIEITFPDGETWTFDGFLTGYAPSADLETIMTVAVTVKVTGAVVVA